jgi:hypothetical protein
MDRFWTIATTVGVLLAAWFVLSMAYTVGKMDGRGDEIARSFSRDEREKLRRDIYEVKAAVARIEARQ